MPGSREPNLLPLMSTAEVAAYCGVPHTTLNFWAREGLVGERLRDPQGRRVTRYWNVREVVTVRAIRMLRSAGCPLQVVRQVHRVLQDHWSATLTDRILIWTGSSVVSIDATDTVMSLYPNTGQGVIRQTISHLVTLPVGAWQTEAEQALPMRDLAQLDEQRLRREGRLAARTVPAVAVLRRRPARRRRA